MIVDKYKITSKEQIDKIGHDLGSNILPNYPKSYPCILVLIEVDSKQGDYYNWYYVYPSDFDKEQGWSKYGAYPKSEQI